MFHSLLLPVESRGRFPACAGGAGASATTTPPAAATARIYPVGFTATAVGATVGQVKRAAVEHPEAGARVWAAAEGMLQPAPLAWLRDNALAVIDIDTCTTMHMLTPYNYNYQQIYLKDKIKIKISVHVHVHRTSNSAHAMISIMTCIIIYVHI